MSYKVRTLQRKRDHRASAVSLGRLWEMNHSSKCVSGTPRRISERPDTGGLTVAVLVRPLQGRRIVRGFRRTACGSPNHSGLTVAALVNMRLCIAQIVFLPTDGHCYSTRSGSGSRPWNVFRMRVRNAEFRALSLYMRFAKPRRADARRSCVAVDRRGCVGECGCRCGSEPRRADDRPVVRP